MERLKIVRHGSQSSNFTIEVDNIDRLPFDLIITEILSRLPAKSVAICRSVSKQWSSLLRRPDFSQMFLTRSSTRPHILLALKYGSTWHFFLCSQSQNRDINVSVDADYHMGFSGNWYGEVCQYVNGLIYLMEKRIVDEKIQRVPVICNPSTGQKLTLPNPRAKNLDIRSFFGYDPIGKQYKVLCMTVTHYRNQINSREHQILTLGTPKLSWRKLECSFPHYPQKWLNGICIKGVLYYIAMFERTVLIACFDFRSEKFSYLETPNSYMQISSLDLMNYKGKLGVLMHGYNKPRELWVLNVTEKDKRWTQFSDWPNAGYGVKKAIWITDKDELVWVRRHWTTPYCINYYNLETATHRRLEIKGIEERLGMGQDLPRRHFIFVDFVENLMLL